MPVGEYAARVACLPACQPAGPSDDITGQDSWYFPVFAGMPYMLVFTYNYLSRRVRKVVYAWDPNEGESGP
jgi:hypothetical protein